MNSKMNALVVNRSPVANDAWQCALAWLESTSKLGPHARQHYICKTRHSNAIATKIDNQYHTLLFNCVKLHQVE